VSRRRNTPSADAAGNVQPDPAATALLTAARRALVTGLAGAPLPTVQAACDVAEALGAAICLGDADVASPLGPVVIRAGEMTADVEELRDRADLVIAWFCDPDSLRPGFGREFLTGCPGGPATREVLAVGPAPVAGASRHLPLPTATAVDAARLLHARLLGHAPPPDNAAAALAAAACGELLTAIRAARCVAFLTCRDDDPTGLLAWATRQLVRQVAHERPAFAVPLPGRTAAAAEAALTWRYGAAGAIARADPLGSEFRPAECSAAMLIARGEVDAVLAVGPLEAEVETAIAARGAGLTVVRIDAGDSDSLTALLRGLRERGHARNVP
jgi:formylmethanofuran dehydrogenase subunit B